MNVEFRMNHGFSIIEVIVAIVVIGIMLAVALPKYNRVVEKSRQAEAFTNLAAIRGAQMRYYAETGEWAGGWDGADSDFKNLDVEGLYDPHDQEFYFEYYTGTPSSFIYSAYNEEIAYAERKDNVKNCCFGEYLISISTAGRISKFTATGYGSVP